MLLIISFKSLGYWKFLSWGSSIFRYVFLFFRYLHLICRDVFLFLTALISLDPFNHPETSAAPPCQTTAWNRNKQQKICKQFNLVAAPLTDLRIWFILPAKSNDWFLWRMVSKMCILNIVSVFVSLYGELFLFWLCTVHSLICWVTWPRPPMASCTQSK